MRLGLPDERWFGLLTQQRLRRGVHKTLRALENDIRDWIKTWNANTRPFTWTAKPKEIIAKVRVLQRDYKRLIANNTK